MFSQSEHVKNSIKASAAIVVCLAVLGAFVVVLGGYRFWEKLEIYNIRFKSVKDLSPGQPVKYGGLDVGRILSVGVDADDPRMIRVVVGLTGQVSLRQGVVARIAQKGLVGDYYVFLDPQGTLGEPLPSGSFIPSAETVDLTQLAAIAGEVLQDLRPRLTQIALSLETVLNSENSARIAEFLSKAPGLVDDLQKTSSKVREDFANLARKGDNAAEALSKTLDSMRLAADAVKAGLTGALEDLRGRLKGVGTLTDTMNKAVRHDQAEIEDILENVDRLSTDLKYLSARLRERPWEVISPPREKKK